MNANRTNPVDVSLRIGWQDRAEDHDLRSRTLMEDHEVAHWARGYARRGQAHQDLATDLDRQAHARLGARDAARRAEETAALGERVQTGLDLENQTYHATGEPPSHPGDPIGRARQQVITRRAAHALGRAAGRAERRWQQTRTRALVRWDPPQQRRYPHREGRADRER